MKRLAAGFACLVLLGACASTAPAARPPPVGASVFEIEQGRFQVTYRGPSRASGDEVRDRALLHAAELTLSRGYDWFRIVDRSMGVAPPTTPRFTFGFGSGSYGRRSGFGLGASTSTGGEPSYIASLQILPGRGPRPPGADVYDARSVADNLRARLP